MKVQLYTNPIDLSKAGDIPKDIVMAFRKAMFDQREMPDTTIMYQMEAAFYDCIRNGNPDELTGFFETISTKKLHMGCMSKDLLRQSQYAFVAGITLATRSAIQGGMPEMEAYNLSDVYTQKADLCKKINEVKELFIVAIYDFAKRVQQAKMQRVYSYPVLRCMKYISNHLHYRITLTDLAERCNLTPQYLSALFRKETGTTLSQYILHEKLETAKQMLAYSDLSLQDIAANLAFNSHSNFTAHFRQQYHITPKQYRENTRNIY